jgi:hypothetical protein
MKTGIGVKINGVCECGASTYESADGSTRCIQCCLHPDQCTCVPERMNRIMRALGLIGQDA